MAEIKRLAEVLKANTQDLETLVEFYESVGEQEKARAMRREKILAEIARKDYELFGGVIAYHQAHNLLTAAELHQVVREYCQHLMKKRPWDALAVAREYHLLDLEKEAATKRSEDILASPGRDVSPALEIARKERAGDEDYCKRAARCAFQRFIQQRNFSSLPGLVKEFPSMFNEDERELATALAEMSRRQLEERNAQARLRTRLAS